MFIRHEFASYIQKTKIKAILFKSYNNYQSRCPKTIDDKIASYLRSDEYVLPMEGDGESEQAGLADICWRQHEQPFDQKAFEEELKRYGKYNVDMCKAIIDY